ncbi:hypothetical protein PL373_18920 [Tenacibaculum maritimum]|nr:hypothetical protein [Tenacibaculum maritimum]MDB0603161.1 hypothetical protein [Tenacibaculum maritimum]MDB0610424.1 hypothetical protein [Tenacibaculum maritimum]
MKVLTAQIQYIHKLLPTVIKDDAYQKAMVVTRFTLDNTKKSTKELTFDQANRLIEHYGGKAIKYDHWAYLDFSNSQHSRMYSALMQLGWKNYSTEKTKYVADLVRFSEWLKSKKSPVQKKVKDMNPKECSKIISALESMLEKSI